MKLDCGCLVRKSRSSSVSIEFDARCPEHSTLVAPWVKVIRENLEKKKALKAHKDRAVIDMLKKRP